MADTLVDALVEQMVAMLDVNTVDALAEQMVARTVGIQVVRWELLMLSNGERANY